MNNASFKNMGNSNLERISPAILAQVVSHKTPCHEVKAPVND